MDYKRLEHIILYIIIVCVALIFATLARISATAIGFDNFTAFIVFLIVLGIVAVVYLSIRIVLQELLLPWIGKGLSKIPYFQNKIKNTNITESINDEESTLLLEDIRSEQLQRKAKEQEEKMNIALEYTRKTFAPHTSNEHIELLCNNLKIYANKLSLETLQPVKIKELLPVDISHFGWNIWNYFNVGKQIDIAYFLKKVFPDIFKDAEIETIKSHLRDEERKGIVKIREILTE